MFVMITGEVPDREYSWRLGILSDVWIGNGTIQSLPIIECDARGKFKRYISKPHLNRRSERKCGGVKHGN